MASGHASAMLAHHHLWCCVRPKKPTQNTRKKQTKNKKDPKLRDHCPLFWGDDVMIWMIWKSHTFFWVQAGEKVMGIYEKRRQHTY